MPDHEKVVLGLEHCSEDGCKSCPYEPDCKMCDGFSILAKDALELINYQDQHIEAFLRDREPIVRCKNCKHYDKQTGICAKGNTHGCADTWFCADAERR